MARMRRVATSCCLILATIGCSGEPVPPPEMPALGQPVPLPDDPARQFDFWLGEWNVLNKHLSGDSWPDTGEAVARIHPVAGGSAVLEQWNGVVKGDALIGSSLRAYDPELDRWEIYLNWHGGRPSGFSRMLGSRNGERIEQFPPDDTSSLRYSFSHVREDSAQWDEARSEDGATWTTRWVMQFTRRDSPLALDASNAPVVQPPESAAAYEQTRTLDSLIGAWAGTARALQDDGSWSEGTARARVTSMIDGFGLLQFVDTSWGGKSAAALGWDGQQDGWVAVRADSRTAGLLRMLGAPQVDGFAFSAPTLRESWTCTGRDTCRFERQTSSDGGTTWHASLEAELVRSASTAAWIDIPKALAPFPDVLTGGQPTLEQLTQAARNGYRTVINLRSPGEEGELPDEAVQVSELGMTYVAIPMMGRPDLTPENARALADALSGPDALPAIVHCKSGNRVGALFALKAHALDGEPPERALAIGHASGLTRLEPAVRELLAGSD